MGQHLGHNQQDSTAITHIGMRTHEAITQPS